MGQGTEEKLGVTKIADDVIAFYACNATMKTNGVANLAGGFTDNLSKNFLGKDPIYKGVKVSQSEDHITLDIFIIVKYGVKIPAVAWDVQENVKKEVEETHRTSCKSNQYTCARGSTPRRGGIGPWGVLKPENYS